MSDSGVSIAELGLSQADIAMSKPQTSRVESQQVEHVERLTPEQALQAVSTTMQQVEVERKVGDKFGFVDNLTNLLTTAADMKGQDTYRVFRDSADLQKLGIRNHLLIRNSLPRQLHERIIKYIKGAGIEVTEDEKQEIVSKFDEQDRQKKLDSMSSYAQHGLLTLNGAADSGLTLKTSASPGDYPDLELLDRDTASANQLRGYELSQDTLNSDLFYGKNSFFKVVLERGNEDIDKAARLPKDEIENRLRNSILFIVNSKKLNLSHRAENAHKEDVVTGGINPNDIDYVLVDSSNYAIAQQAFAGLPINVVEVDSTDAQLEGLYEGPYVLPNYKDALAKIVEQEGPVWSHISRLPEDTYPKVAA